MRFLSRESCHVELLSSPAKGCWCTMEYRKPPGLERVHIVAQNPEHLPAASMRRRPDSGRVQQLARGVRFVGDHNTCHRVIIRASRDDRPLSLVESRSWSVRWLHLCIASRCGGTGREPKHIAPSHAIISCSVLACVSTIEILREAGGLGRCQMHGRRNRRKRGLMHHGICIGRLLALRLWPGSLSRTTQIGNSTAAQQAPDPQSHHHAWIRLGRCPPRIGPSRHTGVPRNRDVHAYPASNVQGLVVVDVVFVFVVVLTASGDRNGPARTPCVSFNGKVVLAPAHAAPHERPGQPECCGDSDDMDTCAPGSNRRRPKLLEFF